MMKQLLALLTALLMIVSLFGCSSSETQQEEPEAAGTKEQQSGTETAVPEPEDEMLTFEYFTTSLAVEWTQQIETALKELGEINNFELLSADANRDIDQQLSQIDTAIDQQIDGAFIFVVDEGSATAVIEKFDTAGIPVIGETLKLQDGDGKNIAPYVELDAVKVGENCGQWVADNWESTGVDLSDLTKVGIIQNTNSKYRSDLLRVEGFIQGLKSGFQKLPENNIFLADCASEATSTDNTEASYNQVNAIIAAHPEMNAWVVMGSVDSYAMGACRAIEACGVEDKSILVSAGGELAVQEWANDAAPAWRAACYYGAMDFAEVMVEGMLQLVKDGKDARDIYGDFKEEGQDYAAVKISGAMCTPETYQDVVGQ